jgi:hypothetical protein
MYLSQIQPCVILLNTTCFEQKLIILRCFNAKILKQDKNTKNFARSYKLLKECITVDFLLSIQCRAGTHNVIFFICEPFSILDPN